MNVWVRVFEVLRWGVTGVADNKSSYSFGSEMRFSHAPLGWPTERVCTRDKYDILYAYICTYTHSIRMYVPECLELTPRAAGNSQV